MLRAWLPVALCFASAFAASAADYRIAAGDDGETLTLCFDAPRPVAEIRLRSAGGRAPGVERWDDERLAWEPAAAPGVTREKGGDTRLVFAPPLAAGYGLKLTGLKPAPDARVRVKDADGAEHAVADARTAAPGARATRIQPRPERDLASMLPGGRTVFGGAEVWGSLTVASPNALNRRDRAIVRLDLTDRLGDKPVRHAMLDVAIGRMVMDRPRRVVVEALPEQEDFTEATGFGHGGERVASLLLDFAAHGGQPFALSLDVTPWVNRALAAGEASVTFRFRDTLCDRRGNPEQANQALYLPVASIAFTLTP